MRKYYLCPIGLSVILLKETWLQSFFSPGSPVYIGWVTDRKIKSFGWRIPHPSGTNARPQILWSTFSVAIWAGRKQEGGKEVPLCPWRSFWRLGLNQWGVLCSARVQSQKVSWRVPVQCFSKRETEELKNLADLNPLCLSLYFSHSIWQKTERLKENKRLILFPNFSLCLPVPLLSVSVAVSWSVLHRGGQRAALLGRLAQLYLLLDDPSWVVDERVDQTGHCMSRADRK